MISFYLTVIAFTLFLVFLIDYIITTRLTRVAKLVNKFSGSPIWPFLGNVVGDLRLENWQDLCIDYFSKYGKVCRLWVFGTPRIMICDAEAVEKIFASPSHVERGAEYKVLHGTIGRGLLGAETQPWRRDRTLLNPAFHRQTLEGFVSICDRKSDTLIRHLSHAFPEKGKKDVVPQSIISVLNNATLEIIFEATMGFELNIQQEGKDSKFAECLFLVMKMWQLKTLYPWYRYPFFLKISGYERMERKAMSCNELYVREALKLKRMEMEQGKLISDLNKNETENTENEFNVKKKNKSFIELLLEANPDAPETYYKDHLNTLVVAGAETTAASVNSTLFFLSLYPEYQKLCQDEVDHMFETHEGRLNMAAMADLQFLEMCWKEALRLRPPVAGLNRKMVEDLDLGNGLVIPKSCDAVVVIYNLHRDEKWFPDPEVYNPYRFTKENSSGRPAHAYIPFGAGIRNCIGYRHAALESKLLLAKILRDFSAITDQTQEEVKYVPGILGAPHPPIRLGLIKRH